MDDNSEYAFFHYDDGFAKRQSNVYQDMKKYLRVEDELEDMITDNVVDIYVDRDGSFSYYPSKISIQALNGVKFEPKHSTFATMLERQNLSINRYNRYKAMFRKSNQ